MNDIRANIIGPVVSMASMSGDPGVMVMICRTNCTPLHSCDDDVYHHGKGQKLDQDFFEIHIFTRAV